MYPRLHTSLVLLLSGIALLAVVIAPVTSDISFPTDTRVYFEQNNTPFNGSVQYNVTCYGYNSYPGTPAFQSGYIPKDTNETVFSYSASCPAYGCVIHETFYLNYRHINRCDLRGEAGGRSFILENFSTTPAPSDCTMLNPFERHISRGDRDEYYNSTPEYVRCMNETYRELDRCDQYLAECNPVTDKDCGNRVINGKAVIQTKKSLACREAANQNETVCDTLQEKVNMTGRDTSVRLSCEQHFTIPPVETGNGTPPGLATGTLRRGPAESLICSILSTFGLPCQQG
jgi:hypothetical protein